MPDRWFYLRDKRRHGPITVAKLKQMAKEGWLVAEDLVWCEELPDWTPASKIPGLFSKPRSKRPQEVITDTQPSQGGSMPGRFSLSPAYGNLLAWFALMSVIAYGVITECRSTVLCAMGGWSLFCFVIHLREVSSLRRPHKQRLRDALRKKQEEAAQPKYYEEPDHFFW